MREVDVPTGYASYRRPIALVVAWLVVLQAFLAGVAAVQAATLSASASLELICHSTDGGNGVAGGPSDDGAKPHHCGACCLSAPPALAAPGAPPVAVAASAARVAVWSPYTVVIAHGAVRAGLSQGPPRRA